MKELKEDVIMPVKWNHEVFFVIVVMMNSSFHDSVEEEGVGGEKFFSGGLFKEIIGRKVQTQNG